MMRVGVVGCVASLLSLPIAAAPAVVPSVVYFTADPPATARRLTASDLRRDGNVVRLASTARIVAIDPALLVSQLTQSGVLEVVVPGSARLSGAWSLPDGTMTIRAGGVIDADRWQLSASGTRLTLEAEDIHLRDGTRVDVRRTHGRGGDVILRSRTGVVEVDRESSIDASGADGKGGRILLAASDVQSRGRLRALGRGRIEVEAARNFEFTSSADTGGGVIRLDPTNMRIGHFSGTNTNVTVSGGNDDVSPNAGTTGQLDVTNLVTMLGSNDVVVHTTSAAGPGTGLEVALTGDATEGDIAVEARVIWNSAFSLTMLAHDDLVIRAPVQNEGAGAVLGIAGWDGATVSGLDAPDPTLASLTYGNGTGDAIVYGSTGTLPTAWIGSSFGSNAGLTTLRGRKVVVKGLDTITAGEAFAMVGFRVVTVGGGATGDIQVSAKDTLDVRGGLLNGNTRFAQIGHGGPVMANSAGVPILGVNQGNLSGNVTVNAGGAVTMFGGRAQAEVQIGHGGQLSNGTTRGSLSGSVTVTGASLTIDTGNQPAQGPNLSMMIGNGGRCHLGRPIQGTADGNITISVTGNLMMDPRSLSSNGGIQIGNGGYLNTTNVAGNGSPGPAANVSTMGAQSGTINVSVGGDLTMYGGQNGKVAPVANTTGAGWSLIGHGGPIHNMGQAEGASGTIDVTVGGNALLQGGGGASSIPFVQIGHGGYVLSNSNLAGTAFGSTRGAVSGAIDLDVTGTLQVLAGLGQTAYAQVGHGGPVWTQINGAQAPNTADLVSADGSVDVTAGSILIRGGLAANRALSYGQIGHGGLLLQFTTTTNMPAGSAETGLLSGAINITALKGLTTTGDLSLLGGPVDASASNYAFVGHGGVLFNTNAAHSSPEQNGASGNILLDVGGESSLVDGTGAAPWMMGHEIEPRSTITSAELTLNTGTLDFASPATSTNATIDNAQFWPRFAERNLVGGEVTLRVNGPNGNDGVIVDQQPLAPNSTNRLNVLASDDFQLSSSVTNAGSGFVDLVADDANPNSPQMSLTALFTIDGSGSIGGAGPTRVFAVSPLQFTPGSYVPATKFGVWHDTFGTPVVGANFKVNATPTLTTLASPSVTIGGSVSDDGTLAGGDAPTGSILFNLYGPNDATCTDPVAFTATVLVTGNGTYSSGSFTPTLAGTYLWTASYGGDPSNDAVLSPCNAPNESVVVNQATPTLTTQASADVTLGNTVSDAATLAGGVGATGSIIFDLYGPDDATCAGPVAFNASIPVSGDGVYSSGPFTPAQLGTYRWVASYGGDVNNAAVTSPCNAPNESVVVSQATPTLTTQASAPVTIGGNISDDATLAGGANPGGTITFDAYGPNDATCSGTSAFTAIIPVAGDGVYSSGSFTPTLAGTYLWVASYGGDANNAPVTSPCNEPNESVVVSQATPTLTTQASAAVAAGGNISDDATLAGGVSPGGTITFDVYGPNDADCSGVIAFTDTVPVAGNAVYSSGLFTTTLAGTYRWVASYSGDANNAPVTSPCNAPNESVGVGLAIPTLTTQASAPVTIGGNISDDATLAGGASPSGTITFDVYGPNDATCAGTSAFTAIIPVAGDDVYSSGPFTTTLAGTYRWVASYSGDANNAPVTSPCNAPNESVVVSQATPTLTTQASAAVALGGNISDDATLAGGASPGGTITFDLYGPNDAACSSAIAFTSTIPVAGNGLYSPASFTPVQAGTYRWIASYSGDSNNAPVTSPCNAPNESVEVSAIGASVSGTKTVSPGPYAVGSTITYTITLTNAGNGPQTDNPGDEFSDILPSTLALVSANATSPTAVANVGTNTVTWNGLIPPAGGIVTITITATILPAAAGTTVSNQGRINFDSDGDGFNDSIADTDDPGVSGSANATAIAVPAHLDAIPTLSPLALTLLCALLGALALMKLRMS